MRHQIDPKTLRKAAPREDYNYEARIALPQPSTKDLALQRALESWSEWVETKKHQNASEKALYAVFKEGVVPVVNENRYKSKAKEQVLLNTPAVNNQLELDLTGLEHPVTYGSNPKPLDFPEED